MVLKRFRFLRVIRLSLIVCVFLISVFLTAATVNSVQAQQSAADTSTSPSVAAEIAAALYAASATQEAAQRSADKRIREQRNTIESLRLEVTLAEGASEVADSQLQNIKSELAEKEQRFVTALAERDRTYAAEIAVFRGAVEDLSLIHI